MKKILSILMALALLVSGGLLSFNQAQAKSSKNYSGEELYKGILFAQGDVAKELSTLWDKKTIKMSNNKKGLAFTDELVKNIKKRDSKYFNNLEKSVYSGDQLAIEKSLNKGAKYFGDFAENKNKVAKTKSTSSKYANDATGACAVWAIYVAAVATTAGAVSHAVVVTAGGAAVAYLAITTTKYLWNASVSGSSFDSEKVVNEIATTFAK